MTAPLNTASLVSSWREAMEGVTPGPWIKVEDDSFDETILVTTEERNGNRCPISATAAGFTEPFDSEQRANAAWIARCSPSGISALLDALEAMGRELAEARAAITEANNSLFGSQGYFLSLNGGPADKYHLSRAIEDLKASGRKEYLSFTTAERLLSESQAEGRRKDERIKVLEEALSEIIAREDKAWKPVRVFRSEQEAELDDARHETWTEAADIARTALAARDEGDGHG